MTAVQEAIQQRPAESGSVAGKPPPLEPGDRLWRTEFERRCAAMPCLKKAELIEGVVHMPSPVSHSHSAAHSAMVGWLIAYSAWTPGVECADDAMVRLDADNEVQPDALLRIATGGQSRISADDYLEGAPELIVEIAGSSASYDLHDKLPVYRRNGVQEYVVWRVYDHEVDWFALQEGRYAPVPGDEDGIVRSRVFPGLDLAVISLLDGDLAAVLAVVQQGVQRAEHATFVGALRREGR